MRVAVCLIVKLENHYLGEWVDYYYNLGFDNVILYDNNDVDGEKPEQVIRKHIKSGFVIIENVRGVKDAQIPSYDACYRKYRHLYDWIAFFDVDEFLDLKAFPDIKTFLNDESFKRFNSIKINWKNYNDNNLLEVKDNDYSIKRFSHHVRYESYLTKSIINTSNISDCIINSAHGPLLFNARDRLFNKVNSSSIIACDVNGVPRRNVRDFYTPGKNNVCLNHYRFKTVEEYTKFKVVRGYPAKHSGNFGLKVLTLSNFFVYNKLTYKKYKIARNIFKLNNRKPTPFIYAIAKYVTSKIDFAGRNLFHRTKAFFYFLRLRKH